MDKGEGGFSHCGHGGGGVNFLQFCADVFYEQPPMNFRTEPQKRVLGKRHTRKRSRFIVMALALTKYKLIIVVANLRFQLSALEVSA